MEGRKARKSGITEDGLQRAAGSQAGWNLRGCAPSELPHAGLRTLGYLPSNPCPSVVLGTLTPWHSFPPCPWAEQAPVGREGAWAEAQWLEGGRPTMCGSCPPGPQQTSGPAWVAVGRTLREDFPGGQQCTSGGVVADMTVDSGVGRRGNI